MHIESALQIFHLSIVSPLRQANELLVQILSIGEKRPKGMK